MCSYMFVFIHMCIYILIFILFEFIYSFSYICIFIFSHFMFMYLHLYFCSLLKWCAFKHTLVAKGFRTKMFSDLNYFVENSGHSMLSLG